MPDPWNWPLPTTDRAVGTGDPANDENASVDALNAMGAGFNILNPAFSGGADPAGSADSLGAINGAISAANTAGGGQVLMPPGLYSLSGTIVPKSNVTLLGAGPGATTLKLANGANVHVISDTATMSNVTLRGFTIDGNKANNAAGGHNIRLGHGFSDVRLQDIYSHDASLHGMITFDDGSDNNRLWVTNCRSDSNGVSANGSGLYLNRTFGAQISNYQAYGNQLDGLQAKGGGPFQAHNVHSGTNGRYGLFLVDGAIGHVNQLHVFSATSIGVFCQLGTGPTRLILSGGEIYDGQVDGIRLDGVANCTLANLLVRNNNKSAATNAGLRITNGCSYTRVTGCSFYDDQGSPTQKYGIWATGTGSNDNIKIDGCDHRGNVTAGFQKDNWGASSTVLDLNGTGTIAYPPSPSAGDHGFAAWNIDINSLGTWNGTLATLGTVYLLRVPIWQPTTITKISWWNTAAGVTPTSGQNFAGIYGAAGGAALVSASADSSVTGTSLQTVTVASTLLTPGYYWVVLLFNAATAPTILRSAVTATIGNANLTGASLRFAVNGTTQTSLPSITPASNVTTNATLFWVALS